MDNVPNEIWLKIFQHLETYDVIQFCTAFSQLSYFLKDKDVVSKFSIGCKFELYKLDLYKYVSENIGYNYVKHLNINKFYWIPVEELRKLIKLLPNLEELCALDTKLGVREKDLKLYNKLKKLSISVEAQQFPTSRSIYSNNLYLLRSFCLKILLKKPDFREIYRFFNELVGLEELWIYDADESISQPIKYDYIVYNLKFLKKLVIKSKVNIPFLEYKPFGLAKVFETRRFRTIIMYYVKCPISNIIPIREVSIFEPFETPLELAWDALQKFHCEMPCGYKNSEHIYMTKSIKDIQFEELNFYYNKCFCVQTFINACRDILLSKNARKLKKLAIKSCLLQCKRGSVQNKQQELNNRTYSFKEITENCKDLLDLEVMSCPNCNVTILEAYPLISGLSNLRTLTIEVPIHLDGKFLKDLFINCVHLEYLNVICVGTNENLNANIYLNIQYAVSLKEFRLENIHINIDRLFSGLGQIKSSNLQRIFVKCEYVDTFESKYLKEFLELNPQLLFLYIAIAKNSASENAKILDLINRFRKENPARIYFVRKDEGVFSGNFPIPGAHKDILYYDTNVGGINFADFQ